MKPLALSCHFVALAGVLVSPGVYAQTTTYPLRGSVDARFGRGTIIENTKKRPRTKTFQPTLGALAGSGQGSAQFGLLSYAYDIEDSPDVGYRLTSNLILNKDVTLTSPIVLPKGSALLTDLPLGNGTTLPHTPSLPNDTTIPAQTKLPGGFLLPVGTTTIDQTTIPGLRPYRDAAAEIKRDSFFAGYLNFGNSNNINLDSRNSGDFLLNPGVETRSFQVTGYNSVSHPRATYRFATDFTLPADVELATDLYLPSSEKYYAGQRLRKDTQIPAGTIAYTGTLFKSATSPDLKRTDDLAPVNIRFLGLLPLGTPYYQYRVQASFAHLQKTLETGAVDSSNNPVKKVEEVDGSFLELTLGPKYRFGGGLTEKESSNRDYEVGLDLGITVRQLMGQLVNKKATNGKSLVSQFFGSERTTFLGYEATVYFNPGSGVVPFLRLTYLPYGNSASGFSGVNAFVGINAIAALTGNGSGPSEKPPGGNSPQ